MGADSGLRRESARNSCGLKGLNRGVAVGCGYGLVVQGHEMFILDFFLAVFALAPFGLLVLFWKAFHEDRGVHPIYRNSKTENRKKNSKF